MAAQFHRVTVLQIHFCDWQWAWEWRQSLSAHQALVEKLAKKMALRRAFAHWKHCILCTGLPPPPQPPQCEDLGTSDAHPYICPFKSGFMFNSSLRYCVCVLGRFLWLG